MIGRPVTPSKLLNLLSSSGDRTDSADGRFRYTAHIRSDGAAFAAAARRGPDAAIPSCPGWSMRDLVAHVDHVFRKVHARVESGDLEMEEVPGLDESDLAGEPLVVRYEEGLALLVDAFDDTDVDAPSWTWFGPKRVGFWVRRMAHEIAIHRWDAENALGAASPIAPDLAADGVSEMIDVHLQEEGTPPYAGPEGVIEFRELDGSAAWYLELTEGVPPRRAAEGAEASAGVEASASDLVLLLWGRLQLEDVEITGDRHLVGALFAWGE